MKALSIRQPWASLIASGRKTIELRTWTTKYRGPLVVCAGSARSATVDGKRVRVVEGDATPLGVVLCVVDLVDVRASTDADAEHAFCQPMPAEFAWVLENARPVQALAVSGKLGLFTPDDALRAHIEECAKVRAA